MRRWLLAVGLGGCLGLLATPALGASSAPKPLFGYNVGYGVGAAAEPVAATLAEARRGGANTVRVGVTWSQVQPAARRHFDFHPFDRNYRAVLRHGLRPLIVVTGAPCWAHPSVRCHADYVSVRPDRRYLGRWRKFVSALAARYRQAVGFEIWNEPNLKGFWGRKPSPAAYSRVLRAAYQGVHRAHSTVPVVLGGVAPAKGWLGFLRGVYRHGGASYSDALAAHLYAFAAPVVGWVLGEARLVDAVRVQYDPSAPLWVTETGVSTATGRIWQPTLKRHQQARSLVAIYRGLSQMGVGLVNVFRLRDPRRGIYPRGTWQTGLGVERRNGAPKPAYCALAKARGAKPRRCRR